MFCARPLDSLYCSELFTPLGMLLMPTLYKLIVIWVDTLWQKGKPCQGGPHQKTTDFQ